MKTLAISAGRRREQFSTRKALNNENRRQNEQVKTKLRLQDYLLRRAERATDPALRQHFISLARQLNAQLMLLEQQDVQNNSTELAIVDFDERHARRA